MPTFKSTLQKVKNQRKVNAIPADSLVFRRGELALGHGWQRTICVKSQAVHWWKARTGLREKNGGHFGWSFVHV